MAGDTNRILLDLKERFSLADVQVVPSAKCPHALRGLPDESFDLVFCCPPFNPSDRVEPFKLKTEEPDAINYLQVWCECISQCSRLLRPWGTLLVFGLPRWLPFLGAEAGKRLAFKYWIAVELWHDTQAANPLTASHGGLLLYAKDRQRCALNRVREAHRRCCACGDYLADWGGKKHKRNSTGAVVSDIWLETSADIRAVANLPDQVLYRAIELCSAPGDSALLAPCDSLEESRG